jgi:glycerol-3-phosphate dehydrogenase
VDRQSPEAGKPATQRPANDPPRKGRAVVRLLRNGGLLRRPVATGFPLDLPSSSPLMPTPSMPPPSPLSRLDGVRVDVVVVGGGITGACIALEAARSGLVTAIVDGEDFGGGATANCLRIVHGGLRYLQQADVRRARESIVERSMWLRSAPHLVEPLPFLLPTWKGTFPPRWMAMAGALANEVLSADRNRGLPADRVLPPSRMLSRAQCSDLVPALDTHGVTGGLLFHDGVMFSPERLTLEVVAAAREAGAITANHVRLDGVDSEGGRVVGCRLRDALTGDAARVHTRWVVNATGASAGPVAAMMVGLPEAFPTRLSLAMNLLTTAPGTGGDAGPGYALLVRSSDRVNPAARRLFVVPWRGRLLVGTSHIPFKGNPQAPELHDADVATFLDQIRCAAPGLEIHREAVLGIQWGLLPLAVPPGRPNHGVRLLRRHRIVDHGAQGRAGALSVLSVKFTTARRVAEEVVGHLLGRHRPSKARDGDGDVHHPRLPLPGRHSGTVEDLLREARKGRGASTSDDVLLHLVRSHGARFGRVLALRDRFPDWDRRVVPGQPVIMGQLLYGVLEEEARTVDDLLWRRTDLGATGSLTDEARQLAREALQRGTSPS